MKKTLIFSFLAVLVPLVYCLTTNHIWEDFLITFRFSQNLVDGKGLLYNEGERVYGFTSPIGVLLPALFYYLTGKTSFLSALWLYRLICIGTFAGAGLLLLKSLNLKDKKYISFSLFTLLFIFESKSVAFTTNGMETAFMLFFLSLYIYSIAKETKFSWILGGLSFSGLMWTRPDGCFYILALSIATLFVRDRTIKENLIKISKMAALCTLLYLPWFLFCWKYYGSPIPHTILAKKGEFLLTTQNILQIWINTVTSIYSPIYYILGGWPAKNIFDIFYIILGLICSFYWTLPTKDKVGKFCSLTFFFLIFYFLLLPPFPWYLPTMSLLSIVVFVQLYNHWHKGKMFKNIFFLSIIFLTLFQFVATTYQIYVQQNIVETGNRKEIGLWLKENVQSHENIYLEPLGYIGYFSQAKIIDFPGLVSPNVVKLKKEKGLNFYSMINEIKPDWIVLRPGEARTFEHLGFTQENYTFVKKFSTYEDLLKYPYLPGMPYLLRDSVYYVYNSTGLVIPRIK